MPWQASVRPRPPAAKLLRAALLLGPLGLAAAGCGDGGGGGPAGPDYPGIDPVSFSAEVQPILAANCTAALCHDRTDRASGLSLESYADLAAGSRFGAMIVPFEPESSHFWLHLTGDITPVMPLGRDPLATEVIDFLKRWIENGAPDDDGAPMYADVTRKAFVACQAENVVAVVDLDTGLTARWLRTDQPHSVYVDRTRRELWVSRFENATDNVEVYDADTYALLRTGQAGTFPALMGMPPGVDQLWVTNFSDPGSSDHRVRVLDPITLAVVASWGLPAGLQPHGLAFTADGQHVFVTNILSDTVTIFRTGGPGGTPGVFMEPIPLPSRPGTNQQPQQCVLSADGTRLFVTALNSHPAADDPDEVHVLDVSDLAALAAADPADLPSFWTASVTVGDGPWHAALSPAGNELWVSNWKGRSVSVVDVSSPDVPAVVATLAPLDPVDGDREVFQRPIGIAFSPDGSQVFVTNANDDLAGEGHHPTPGGEKPPGNVAIVDAVTREVVRVAEVPNFARFVDFLP